MSRILKVAVSQFPITADITKNLEFIKKYMNKAKNGNADIVHFPECCLHGYPGIDFFEFTPGIIADTKAAITEIKQLAKEFSIWVIFGSNNFENDPPYNTLFVINDNGEIAEKYHKRMLYGENLDLKYYAPGKDPVVFMIKGIKCGLLICHEWRYPELYRQYKHLGVEVLFQSWFDGGSSREDYLLEGINQGEVLPGFVRGNAANNCMWISASNTSKRESTFPSMLIQPDGAVHSKLKRNVPGVLICEIDMDKTFPDPSGHLRDQVSRMNLQ